jgi:protein O-mannosyl-transferase
VRVEIGESVSQTLEAPVATSACGCACSAEQAQRWKTPLIAALLAVFTLTLYAASLRNGFVALDDPVYITANPLIKSGLVWTNVVGAWNAIITGEWHPLTLISHMADVQMFGTKPAGHHFVSALWHAFNVALLFLLLNAATRFRGRSAVVAGLFAAFPLNVEAVAWAAERKSLLSTAFLLLAIGAYGWYVRRPGVPRYLLVMLFFALGLMSKPMIITLPCALLLLDYWPLRRFDLPGPRAGMNLGWGRQFLKLAAEKIPLLLVSAGSSLIATHAMRRYGAVVSLDFYPVQWRVKNTIFSYLLYIGKGLWPTHLAVFYPYQGSTLPVWKVAAAGLVLLGITAAVWHFREKRFLVTGWFWYLGILVPVIGIVQVGHQGLADRYAYVPFIGIFVMLVWLVSEIGEWLSLSRVMLTALALAAIAGYAVTTYAQIGYWHDSYTLWAHAVEVTSQNAFAEESLAQILTDNGRPDLAAQHFEAAIGYLPRWPMAHFDYANLLQQQGRFPDALREYRLALAYETEPDEACASHTNMGAIFIQLNQLPAAVAEFNAAISVRPKNWLPYLNRGLVEYTQGDLEAALKDFSQSLQLEPTPKAYLWQGKALEDKGSLTEAATAYQNALRAEPDLNEARDRLNAIRTKLR